MVNLYVKEFYTNKIVKAIPIINLSRNHVEKVMLGLLRSMDTDRFYINDDEVEQALAEAEKGN